MSVWATAHVRQKLAEIETVCHQALLGKAETHDYVLARDADVVPSRSMPAKPGFSKTEGRARLLHDLGNIELQAMELALRSLVEYPEAPAEFREELAALTLSEASHLKLCLDAIEELGHRWGEWPVHTGLWQAVSPSDHLIDRVLIVHRYLEGSGLDAGDRLLARLRGMELRDVTLPVIERIQREEIGHVDFGSRWFRHLCEREKLDPSHEFPARMNRLRRVLPYRTENLSRELRLKAGFTDDELVFLEDWRKYRPAEDDHRRG